ncbi:MAG TPA: YdeI/OmpD-associated family protein [Pyrinomonadaceae bacterium]|nr:YdeI/OmpD-associated family protein [Pyrinomonadaceae bacterium]
MPKVVKAIKFTAVLDSSGNGSGWHFVGVPREIGERFPALDGKSRRVVCKLNGKEEFQCALMPSSGEFYIMVNKEVRTRLGIFSGNSVEVLLKLDDSKYGMTMPAELEEVMRQDPEGDRLFHALTPGKQRSLMWQVSKGKDVDLRIHRALIIMEHLKDNVGKVDGEKLYREMKRPVF